MAREPWPRPARSAAAVWASIAIYNADLYQGELDRRNELERTVAALEATMSIARALGAETDLGRVLELVTKRGRALVEARIMVIALVEGDELVVSAVAGAAGAGLLGRRLKLTSSLGAATASSTDDGERLAGEATRLRRALAREVGATSGLLVPLRYRQDTVGVLAAFDRMDGDTGFAAGEERLLAHVDPEANLSEGDAVSFRLDPAHCLLVAA